MEEMRQHYSSRCSPVLEPLRDHVLLSEDGGSVQIVTGSVLQTLGSPGVTFSCGERFSLGEGGVTLGLGEAVTLPRGPVTTVASSVQQITFGIFSRIVL